MPGRPGTGPYQSRLHRAARKLAADPTGFTTLVARRLVRSTRAFATEPVESLVLARERFADRHELRGKARMGDGVMPWPPCPYPVDLDWDERLHAELGARWPCPEHDAFERLWPEALSPLVAQGLRLGRGAFAGWGDGEPGLVRALWCLVRHLRPARIVETGVGRGISSRFVLEALERNGAGHLWSIDLPPLGDPELHDQIGLAVPIELHHRWTFVRGSSRRRLPRLLADVQPIDLFVHDSAHTARNVLFELGQAWASLSSAGVAVVDDVDLNCGFHTFKRDHGDALTLLCQAEPLEPDAPRQNARGVFAVVGKPGFGQRGGAHVAA